MKATWSVSPLTAPEHAKLDERFLGVWQTGDPPSADGRDYVVHVSAAGEEFPKGMMRLLLVTHPKPPEVLAHHEFLAFASVVDDQQYLNVLVPENSDLDKPDPAKLKKWDPKFKAAYLLFEVQHSDTAIRLRAMNIEKLERHVIAQDVPGKLRATNGQTTGVGLTGSIKKLAQFVSKHQRSILDRTGPGGRFARVNMIE